MRISLDGHQLEIDAGTGWSYTQGVRPHIRAFFVDDAAAHAIFNGGSFRTSTLKIDTAEAGYGSLEVKGLTVLGIGPSGTFGVSSVAVADGRWFWRRKWFKRGYNVRRRSGDKRRLSDGSIAVATIDPDIKYHAWSLQGDVRPWSGIDVLRDVMDDVVGPAAWSFKMASGELGLPEVENLEVDARGDAAIAQVFRALGGGIGIYIDAEGEAVVFDRLDESEFDLVGQSRPVGQPPGGTKQRDAITVPGGKLGPALTNARTWIIQDRRRERPSEVRVYFNSAVEFRVDSIESEQPSVGTAVLEPVEFGVKLRMDWYLTAPEDATVDGESIVASTWVRGMGWVEYLTTLTPPRAMPAFTLTTLRTGYLSPAALAYGSPLADPTGLWLRRVQAPHNTFRRVYRIRSSLMDRLESIRAYRTAVLSRETGARGQGTVYADHCQWITWRWLEAGGELESSAALEVLRNIYANASAFGGSIVGTPIEDLRAAPARIGIIDEQLGIIELQYDVDFTGQVTRIVQSALISPPTNDPTSDNQWLQNGQFTADHEVSVVLSAVLGAPNGKEKLHRIDVKPEDVGVTASAEGPIWELRVKDPKKVARFAWRDIRAESIKRFMSGTLEKSGKGVGAFTGPARGWGFSSLTNQAHLRAAARAAAKSVYSHFADHVQGGHTASFAPLAEPSGTANISHHAGAGGVTTTASFPANPPDRSPDSFLPPAIRRIIEGFVEP